MKKQILPKSLSVLLCYTVVLWSIEVDNQYIQLNFDRVFPISNFNRVEMVCKELWSDLDLLQNNDELQKKLLYESDYLIEQFLLLQKKLEYLIGNKDEASSFLIEDINYLAAIFNIVEEKYQALRVTVADKSLEKCLCIDMLLENSKNYLSQLYCMNREIIGSC